MTSRAVPPLALDESLLAHLSAWLGAQMGLHFPRERWRDLERGLRAAAPELGFDDPAACAQWLVAAPLARRQIETLAGHLTVGETYFLRDRKLFEALETRLLPELIQMRRQTGEWRLRLWSAGCCTGEEPYSVAILLHRLLPDLPRWNVSVLATDINPRFLEKAATGLYGEWSFRDTPPWLKERYFTRTAAGRYRIAPEIRRMVTFAYLNLAEDAYPSLLNNTNALDVIFCRNVLIYFLPERIQQVVENFHRALVEGGWLLVSPSETSLLMASRFSSAGIPGVTFYQKTSHQPASALMPGLAPGLIPELAPAPTLAPVAATPWPLPALTPALTPTWPAPPPEPERPAPPGPASRTSAPAPSEPAPSPTTTAEALEAQARACANDGRLEQALDWCEQAVASAKMNAGCHYLRATILQELGRPEEAAPALRRALYLDPAFVLAHFALGNLARGQGKRREAARHLANALQLLRGYAPEAIVPESDGITAGRLAAIIEAMTEGENS